MYVEKKDVYIDTAKKLDRAIGLLKDSEYLYLDIETFVTLTDAAQGVSALDPLKNRIRLLSLSDGLYSFCFDLGCLYQCREKLFELVSSKYIIGHHLKFDLKSLADKFGLEILPKAIFDTYVGARLLWEIESCDPHPKGTLSLKEVLKRYKEVDICKFQQNSNWGAEELTEDQLFYAVSDVESLDLLYPEMVKRLNRISGTDTTSRFQKCTNPIVNLEMDFLLEQIRIELTGIPINHRYLNIEYSKLESKVKKKEEYFKNLGINPMSPLQVKRHLDDLGIIVEKTGKQELAKHVHHPFVAALLEIRVLKNTSKLIDGYMKKSITRESKPGRIYPNYAQIAASSGRMSSSKPNVQQLPRCIRDTFYRRDKGKVILEADYPAIEPRIAAIVTNDTRMIRCFQENNDLHRQTAAFIFNKQMFDVSDEERKKAKVISLGFLYGMGVDTFRIYAYNSCGIDFSEAEATTFKNRFLEIYRGIHRWHRRVGAELRTTHRQTLTKDGDRVGIIRCDSLLGRAVKVKGYNLALNVPIQGTGADILKLAVIKFGKIVREQNINAQIINLVHDEIIVEADETQAEEAKSALKTAMEKACNGVLRQFKTTVEVKEMLKEAA
jgi:DNA polymerase-1